MASSTCSGNILLATDSYKVTHHLQYPPGTTTVYSYFEPRGGKFAEVTFFGLQYLIKKWLLGVVVTEEKIKEAAALYSSHFMSDTAFNEAGWRYVLKEHGGRLPIRIKAVPEGTTLPAKNVCFSVENTDPECYWLTNYVETLLVQAWYPMTVCTNSREQKKLLKAAMEETCDTLDKLPFMLHDFGFRGVSSCESAAIGGAAHLVNFMGTDTIASIVCVRDFYSQADMPAFSVPASEHSTMTSWGAKGEVAACKNMLDKFPTGLVSVVSDSYDIFNCVENIWGGELKADVEKRTEGSLVVRPDSGDPKTMVLKVLELLDQKFGSTVNTKGFKVLPAFVRVIQGDGVSLESLQDILAGMKEAKWSLDNIVFGSGGALLQKLNRDTCKCAFKCSFAVVDGEERNVYKDPISDKGKKSKKGRLTLECNDGKWTTVTEGKGDPAKDQLVTVFENGILKRDYTLAEVRENAKC